jgi:hypothetical protein
MDLRALASLYICRVCGKLPIRRAAGKEGGEDRPVAAQDGHFYHESCIKREFERAGAGGIISPVTNNEMGATLIHAKTVQCFLEKLTRNGTVDRGLLEDSREKEFDLIRETKEKAEGGSFEHMALLGRWHLLNEVEGVKQNATEGFGWCKKAGDGGDCNGMAYQAIWLIHGDDEIEKNWYEGSELLLEAAHKGSGMFTSFSCLSFEYLVFISRCIFMWGGIQQHMQHTNSVVIIMLADTDLRKVGALQFPLSVFSRTNSFTSISTYTAIALVDRKRALRWLRKAAEQKSLLSETERGNVENYLSIISV